MSRMPMTRGTAMSKRGWGLGYSSLSPVERFLSRNDEMPRPTNSLR